MAGKYVIKAVRGLFLAAVILLGFQPVKGQLIGVQSMLERDSLMIGEQIKYTLKIDAAMCYLTGFA